MKIKFIITTLVFAVPALLLGRTIWPDAADIVAPTASQFPFFVFLATVEALAFGIGVSFLIYGWNAVKRVMPDDRRGAVLVLLSITWLLASWWPHDNLHRHNGMDIAGLLKIEYGFHLTLVIASLIVAYYFWKFLKRSTEIRSI